MDHNIGKLLDNRYELLERVGTGGMAMVYKAKCHWLNRFVAVKILREELAQDEEFRHRFHEESQAVAMLSHPNIVSVYDVSRSSEMDYIVMELIDGLTLKQYMLKRGGKLSWKEALHFITQIMKALSHAHSRGIIHRDIKPHNIMVLRDGSVKVADFGIARLASAAQNTMTQEALGSVHYISPEQARGSRIDARSDIYSAGVVLYEMLTGRLPYEGETPVAVAIQHINSIPLSPREIEPSIPEALEEITMKAMSSSLDKRYVSADAMLTDLEEFRKNPNISFDYTPEDLLSGESDEPTQVLGANSPQTVISRPVHAERFEDTHSGRQRLPALRDEPEEYEDEEESGGRKTKIIIGAILAVVVGLACFLWLNVFSDIRDNKTIMVPDVLNLTLEEAQALPSVKENGFIVEEGALLSHESVPAGRIIQQTPEKNSVADLENMVIKVDISAGPSTLTMPDVYNQDHRLAISTLRGMGLEVDQVEDYSSDVTKGNVMKQVPAADEKVEKGQRVTIVVSQGPKIQPVTVITLTGMNLEQAKKVITDLGLKLGEVKEVANNEFAAGVVCYQSIPPRKDVPVGSVINLYVSAGSESETSPEPSETEEPDPSTDPGPQKSQREVVVNLPNDRDMVDLRISVNGVDQIHETIETKMRIARRYVEGAGVQKVIIYLDDVEVEAYDQDFGA